MISLGMSMPTTRQPTTRMTNDTSTTSSRISFARESGRSRVSGWTSATLVRWRWRGARRRGNGGGGHAQDLLDFDFHGILAVNLSEAAFVDLARQTVKHELACL